MRYVPVVKNTFPVSLILEGKSCLVVGGGKAAVWKIENLLTAGAAVTVISPELGEQAAALHLESRFTWIKRFYSETDLEGFSLVYCATPDADLNRSILEQCRQKRILCCPVDRNWPEGDFMTPATFRKDELAISISTGGASCRRSRLIKQSLSRHVDLIDSADLILIGTSHSYLPLKKREPFHLAGKKLDSTGNMLHHVWGVHEFLILNTCNRVEILAVVSNDSNVYALVQRILGFDTLDRDEYYIHRGWDAFSHSCTLMAGLFSQTPGENHIVAQVKEALHMAVQSSWAGVVLEDWISRALGVSKKIRRESSPLLKNIEIEDVAVEYIYRTLEKKQGLRKAMVIGTGIIGTGVLEKFLIRNIPVLWCYHRYIPGMTASMKEKVELFSLADLNKRIAECDCAVTATGSSEYLLDEEHLEYFPEDKQTLLVDLSLPRNISPELNRPEQGVEVFDLDDLKHWFRREIADMDHIMEVSRKIIEENKDSYERISGSLQSRHPRQ